MQALQTLRRRSSQNAAAPVLPLMGQSSGSNENTTREGRESTHTATDGGESSTSTKIMKNGQQDLEIKASGSNPNFHGDDSGKNSNSGNPTWQTVEISRHDSGIELSGSNPNFDGDGVAVENRPRASVSLPHKCAWTRSQVTKDKILCCGVQETVCLKRLSMCISVVRGTRVSNTVCGE